MKILNKIGYLYENLICCCGFFVDVYLNCPLKLWHSIYQTFCCRGKFTYLLEAWNTKSASDIQCLGTQFWFIEAAKSTLLNCPLLYAAIIHFRNWVSYRQFDTVHGLEHWSMALLCSRETLQNISKHWKISKQWNPPTPWAVERVRTPSLIWSRFQ